MRVIVCSLRVSAPIDKEDAVRRLALNNSEFRVVEGCGVRAACGLVFAMAWLAVVGCHWNAARPRLQQQSGQLPAAVSAAAGIVDVGER